MTKEIKSITLLALVSALFVSIGVTLATGSSIRSVDAVCEHEGNHYTAKSATKQNTGIREYWVCCKCHEHFLETTEGTWINAGTANITIDSSDDRFIPKTNSYDAQGLQYSADGKTITGYNYWTVSKNIVIPEGITGINSSAFSGAPINSVSIPSTVTKIGDGAFKNCSSLKTVTIADGVEEIGEYSFQGTAITEITIPASVGTIGGGSFSDCSKLAYVDIKEGVDSIESAGSWPGMNGAFQDCTALKYIVIPSTVTEMDGYEFASANDDLVIYCVASSKPSGWDKSWNRKHQVDGLARTFKTYWGLNSGWHYDAKGIPTKGAK